MAVVFGQRDFPIWFDDIEEYSIATADFNPGTTVTAYDHENYQRNGFALKNGTETAGFIRAVTLAQYLRNNKSVTGIVPRRIDLNGGDWALTPLIKVFAANDATYPSTGMTIVNIGLIK